MNLEKYYEIKENSIDKYLVNEGEFKALAYVLLGIGRTNEAIELLKITLIQFPESSKIYDSLGEMYLSNGDKELALVSYKKSVDLNPNNISGKKILEKLIHDIG